MPVLGERLLLIVPRAEAVSQSVRTRVSPAHKLRALSEMSSFTRFNKIRDLIEDRVIYIVVQYQLYTNDAVIHIVFMFI